MGLDTYGQCISCGEERLLYAGVCDFCWERRWERPNEVFNPEPENVYCEHDWDMSESDCPMCVGQEMDEAFYGEK